MPTRKDSRDAQLAELLAEGRSYEDVAEIANMKVPAVKAAIRKKYPDLYMSLRTNRGVRTASSEQLDEMRQKARAHRQKQQQLAKKKKQIADYFFAEPLRTLEETGEEFGVTREYVRQIANQWPGRYAAKKSAKKAALKRKNAKPPRYCRTCGGEITEKGRVKYCCEEHYLVRVRYLRYHVDENFRSKHVKTVARWAVNNPEKLGATPDERERLLKYHQRVLDDAEDIETHGRWLVQGSDAMKAALDAYREGWAIFTELPEEIQEQVKRVAETALDE